MSRPTLCLAPKAKPAPRAPTFSQVKKAIRMFKGRNVSKATYRRNALAWLKARERMGEQHILNKSFTPTWGQPGDGKGVSQIHAPRRLGQRP